MQVEIDKYIEQIKVLLERLARKEAEIRRLIVEISEFREIKIKFEQVVKEHKITINKITTDFELMIKRLKEEIASLTKQLKAAQDEYEKLVTIHRKCPADIARLEEEIRRLKRLIEDLQRRRPEFEENDEVEEKFEIVSEVQVRRDEQQFEGIGGRAFR